MRRLVLAALAVAATVPLLQAAHPAAAAAQGVPGARVWLESERDYFRRGERLQVRFTVSDDAHVAVVHIDTDGRLDFLYPSSPWDDGYVRGGRHYTLPQGGYSARSVGTRPGIGYLYIIASSEPLDFGYFGGSYSRTWDWSFAGRNVRGDPYVALEQITRLLVPGWPGGYYTVDHYSYMVDGRHNYPAYACGSTGWGYQRGWGWTSHYGSCNRLIVFLRDYPGYFDTHAYRGDRWVWLRGTEFPDPRHGFKSPATGNPAPAQPGGARGRTGTPGPVPVLQGRIPRAKQPEETTERRRPVLERRGEGSGGSVRAAPPTRRPAGGTAKPSAKPPAKPAAKPAPKPAAPAKKRGGGGEAKPIQAPAVRGKGGGGEKAGAPAGPDRPSRT